MITRTIPLSVLPLLIASPAWGQPPAQAGTWYSRFHCDDSKVPAEYPLPAPLAKETVLRELLAQPLTRSETEAEVVCGVFGKVWKSQKQPSIVVVLETLIVEHDRDSDLFRRGRRRLRMGLYRQEAGGFKLAATTAEPVELEDREEAAAPDLAPYKLTPSEYAFGVRVKMSAGYAGGWGVSEYLKMFRVEGRELRSILSLVMMSYSDTSEPTEEGPREHSEHGSEVKAEISVLPTRTRGIFDWKVKGPERSVILKWDGSAFTHKGRPAVKEWNEH